MDGFPSFKIDIELQAFNAHCLRTFGNQKTSRRTGFRIIALPMRKGIGVKIPTEFIVYAVKQVFIEGCRGALFFVLGIQYRLGVFLLIKPNEVKVFWPHTIFELTEKFDRLRVQEVADV